jgi:uncharacterized protein
MTFANLVNAAQETAKLPREPRPAGFHPTSRLTPIFSGPNGLRAGWRLLIFLALLGVPAAGLFALAHAYGGQPQQVTLTPVLMAVNEALVLLILCIATWIMGRIEHRKFTDIRSAPA